MASKSLGTLTLDLVAKTAGFIAGMDKAERASTKWQKQVSKNLKQLDKELRFAGKAIGVGLGAAAAAVVKSTLESENATKQLEARLKSTAGISGKTAEELLNLANALQGTTTYGDEAIVEMETLLLKFTNIRGELFNNAIPAVLDMSAALGKDLTSSALILGKALNDPIKGITALAKSGVKFSEQQKDVIKQLVETGRTAEAQALILEGFNQQFGGSAEAAADTFSGAMKQAYNALGELFEAPGGLNASKESLQELTTLLKDPATIAAAGELANAIVRSFTAATAAIKGTVEISRFLGEALAAAAGSVAVDDAGRAIYRIAELEKRISALSKVEDPSDNQVARLELLQDELDSLSKAYELNLELSNTLANVPPPKTPAPAATGAPPPVGRTKEQIEAEKQAAKDAERLAKQAAAAAEKQAQAIADSIAALQFQADTVGKTADEIKLLELANEGASESQIDLAKAALSTVSAFEKNKKAQEDYQGLIQDLRTDEEKLTDQLNERLAVLTAINNVPAEEREQVKSRIAAAAFTEAPQYEGLAPEVGGALGESFKLEDAQKELEAWYATQLSMLEENRKAHADLNAQWNDEEASLAQEHADRLAEIDRARGLVAYNAAEEGFGALAGLAKQFAGEQSDAYKVLFAAEKAAAIARSIVAIQTALAQASASAPFPANLAAMATVAAQTAGIVATISSVALQGQAHDGLMSVPKTGTYLLEKGERVTTANTSAKLDKTLEETKKSQGRSATNLRIVNAFDTGVIGDYLGSSSGEQLIMNTVKRNQRTIQSLSR